MALKNGTISETHADQALASSTLIFDLINSAVSAISAVKLLPLLNVSAVK